MLYPPKSGFIIRLVRMGCKNRPYFQIGAMPAIRRIGLLPDEVIGSLDPVPNERNEIMVAIDLNRLAYWQGRGGQLSIGMETLMGLAGWTPIPPHAYIKAKKFRDEANKPVSQKENEDDETNEYEEIESVLPKRRLY